jgi:hypothetical protein
MDLRTTITTAEGDVKSFGGFAAKMIVAHPRAAALAAFIAGFLVGHLI